MGCGVRLVRDLSGRCSSPGSYGCAPKLGSRLFYVRNDGTGMEFFNEEQLRHMFRTYDTLRQDPGLIQSANKVQNSNETCITHVFIAK